MLREVDIEQLDALLAAPAIDAATREEARVIVDRVSAEGESALRAYAEKFGDVSAGGEMFYGRNALDRSLAELAADDRGLLERTCEQITQFASQQVGTLNALDCEVPGGRAGHRLIPMHAAGCYAPGGRYPLPSSVLMTAATARVAGVAQVWVASPKPTPITLAAAAVAGADGLLAVGGPHAIAALAAGLTPLPACDIIVGPGNRWVTAAKHLVSDRVAIDMLAGPSELVVLADASADPALVAADLLAQAEHDVDARPILVTNSASLAHAVNDALAEQLVDLPTAETALHAVQRGFALIARDLDEAIDATDRIAPEHLQVMTRDSRDVAERITNFGGIFIGAQSAEVFGDYGIGPNHVLPTAGTARRTGGLSVLNFLRVHTWLEIDAAPPRAIKDAARLARLEGLEAHARAAERRLGS